MGLKMWIFTLFTPSYVIRSQKFIPHPTGLPALFLLCNPVAHAPGSVFYTHNYVVDNISDNPRKSLQIIGNQSKSRSPNKPIFIKDFKVRSGTVKCFVESPIISNRGSCNVQITDAECKFNRNKELYRRAVHEQPQNDTL